MNSIWQHLKSSSKIHCYPLWTIILVLTWWTANTIASIASKIFIGQFLDYTLGVTSLTEALNDLRWIDLTAIQLVVSWLFSFAWIKFRRIDSLVSSSDNKHSIVITSLMHLIGNLATNASYAGIKSSTTQMIKACEPVFTFLLLFILRNNDNETLRFSVLFSLLAISAGTCLFVAEDSSFNVWGILAALISGLAFSIRNIYVKNVSTSWRSVFLEYSYMSLYGFIFLLPIAMIKLTLTKKVPIDNLGITIASASSHLAYNVASINIVQAISPLHYDLLNLFKSILAILINILYFHTPLSGVAEVGFVMFIVGLLLYYKTSHHLSFASMLNAKTKPTSLILLTVFTLFFFKSNITSLRSTALQISNQNTRSWLKTLYNPDHTVHQESMTLQLNIVANLALWVYERPLPDNVIENLNTWHEKFPNRTVHLSCGSFDCVEAFTNLNQINSRASFLVISDLVENTTFQRWFARHPLNKVLEGVNFENHLQQVVLLALTWRYGGTYIDPRLNFQNLSSQCVSNFEEPCIAISSDNPHHSILGLFNFPKEHLFIRTIGLAFLDLSTKEAENMKAWPLEFRFREIILNTCNKNRDLCPRIIQVDDSYISESDNRSTGHSFGTLSYDTRVHYAASANLGDEIQGFPGLQFVPFIDEFLEIDKLHKSQTRKNVSCFFNAWWGSPHTNWPPPENIDPIMLSMHIGSAVNPIISKNIEYLRKRSPIGCRDPSSLEYLTKEGVEAFFSGCLTLLLKNPTKQSERSDNIYFADISEEVKKLLPSEIQQKGIVVEHKMNGADRYDKFVRFKAGYDLIEKYSRAKVVITQRIHSALPCVAMGIPVIFINYLNMTGRGGTKSGSSSQTHRLDGLCYLLDLYKLSSEEAKMWLHNFDWINPRPAPNVSLLKKLRATAWNVIRRKKELYEAALTFGVIPFKSFIPNDKTNQKQFHLIFNTKSTGFIKLFSSGYVYSSFTWRNLRAIESIFYHHPLAKVIVHSNTLPHHLFGVLKESGYDIEVRRFSLTDLVKGTPAERFIAKQYKWVKNGPHWYSHETDLLRMAILYRMGGVYMDTDVIIVRSIDKLPVNVVGYESKRAINGAFMYFEKGHPFLKKCLANYAEHYKPNDWGANGPRLITNILHSNESSQYNVTVLDKQAFYMFWYSTIIEQCFQQTSGTSFEYNWKTLREKAIVVHLFSKLSANQGLHEELKHGTICKHLLNSFCVLCDKTY